MDKELVFICWTSLFWIGGFCFSLLNVNYPVEIFSGQWTGISNSDHPSRKMYCKHEWGGLFRNEPPINLVCPRKVCVVSFALYTKQRQNRSVWDSVCTHVSDFITQSWTFLYYTDCQYHNMWYTYRHEYTNTRWTEQSLLEGKEHYEWCIYYLATDLPIGEVWASHLYSSTCICWW